MDGEACDGENSDCRNVSDLFQGRAVFRGSRVRLG
jgi:hypothetical protein